MYAQDIMTRHLITTEADASVTQAIQQMLRHGVSGLPVLDAQGKVMGILTEGDLLRREELRTGKARPRWLAFLAGPGKLAEEYVRTHSMHVRDVMTTPVITVTPAATLRHIVRLMERHGIKRLPVADEDGRLVGLISRANLMRALLMVTQDMPASMPSDEEIKRRVLDELSHHAWARQAMPGILVSNGVVNLYGTVTDHREADALRVAAENVAGVTLVRTHFAWSDPSSAQVFDMDEERVVPPSRQR